MSSESFYCKVYGSDCGASVRREAPCKGCLSLELPGVPRQPGTFDQGWAPSGLHTHTHTSLWAPCAPWGEMSPPRPLLEQFPLKPRLSTSPTNRSTQTWPKARGRHCLDQGAEAGGRYACVSVHMPVYVHV